MGCGRVPTSLGPWHVIGRTLAWTPGANQPSQFSICSQLPQPEQVTCHVHLVAQSLVLVAQMSSQFSSSSFSSLMTSSSWTASALPSALPSTETSGTETSGGDDGGKVQTPVLTYRCKTSGVGVGVAAGVGHGVGVGFPVL